MEPTRGWLRSWQQRALQERDLRESITSSLFGEAGSPRTSRWSWLPALGCTVVIIAGMGVAVWVFAVTAPTTGRPAPQARPSGMDHNAPLGERGLGGDLGRPPLDLGRGELIHQESIPGEDPRFRLRRLPGQAPSPGAEPSTAPQDSPPPPQKKAEKPASELREPTRRQPPARSRDKERKPPKPIPQPTLRIEVVGGPVEVTIRTESGVELATGVQEKGWTGAFTDARLEVEVSDRRAVQIWVTGSLQELDGEGPIHLWVDKDGSVSSGAATGTVKGSFNDGEDLARAAPSRALREPTPPARP